MLPRRRIRRSARDPSWSTTVRTRSPKAGRPSSSNCRAPTPNRLVGWAARKNVPALRRRLTTPHRQITRLRGNRRRDPNHPSRRSANRTPRKRSRTMHAAGLLTTNSSGNRRRRRRRRRHPKKVRTPSSRPPTTTPSARATTRSSRRTATGRRRRRSAGSTARPSPRNGARSESARRRVARRRQPPPTRWPPSPETQPPRAGRPGPSRRNECCCRAYQSSLYCRTANGGTNNWWAGGRALVHEVEVVGVGERCECIGARRDEHLRQRRVQDAAAVPGGQRADRRPDRVGLEQERDPVLVPLDGEGRDRRLDLVNVGEQWRDVGAAQAIPQQQERGGHQCGPELHVVCRGLVPRQHRVAHRPPQRSRCRRRPRRAPLPDKVQQAVALLLEAVDHAQDLVDQAVVRDGPVPDAAVPAPEIVHVEHGLARLDEHDQDAGQHAARRRRVRERALHDGAELVPEPGQVAKRPRFPHQRRAERPATPEEPAAGALPLRDQDVVGGARFREYPLFQLDKGGGRVRVAIGFRRAGGSWGTAGGRFEEPAVLDARRGTNRGRLADGVVGGGAPGQLGRRAPHHPLAGAGPDRIAGHEDILELRRQVADLAGVVLVAAALVELVGRERRQHHARWARRHRHCDWVASHDVAFDPHTHTAGGAPRHTPHPCNNPQRTMPLWSSITRRCNGAAI